MSYEKFKASQVEWLDNTADRRLSQLNRAITAGKLSAESAVITVKMDITHPQVSIYTIQLYF